MPTSLRMVKKILLNHTAYMPSETGHLCARSGTLFPKYESKLPANPVRAEPHSLLSQGLARAPWQAIWGPEGRGC